MYEPSCFICIGPRIIFCNPPPPPPSRLPPTTHPHAHKDTRDRAHMQSTFFSFCRRHADIHTAAERDQDKTHGRSAQAAHTSAGAHQDKHSSNIKSDDLQWGGMGVVVAVPADYTIVNTNRNLLYMCRSCCGYSPLAGRAQRHNRTAISSASRCRYLMALSTPRQTSLQSAGVICELCVFSTFFFLFQPRHHHRAIAFPIIIAIINTALWLRGR